MQPLWQPVLPGQGGLHRAAQQPLVQPATQSAHLSGRLQGPPSDPASAVGPASTLPASGPGPPASTVGPASCAPASVELEPPQAARNSSSVRVLQFPPDIATGPAPFCEREAPYHAVRH